MKLVKTLFGIHLAALSFCVLGLLVMMPHPQIWLNNPLLAQIYPLGLAHGAETYMLPGAATMLVFGWFFVGRKKTAIFFVVASALPLSMELIGTSTGWPFGPYAYTDELGAKIAGRVPYAIPLSWFYMGFTAYILASVILSSPQIRWRSFWKLLLGAWLLTAWDLVLDPAMASSFMPIKFWVWHVSGPYFGMPIKNLIGWSMTGLAFMTISRLLWREDLQAKRIPVWVPFGVYAANLAFASLLSLNVGLWQPIIGALLLGLAPAALALRPQIIDRLGGPGPDHAQSQHGKHGIQLAYQQRETQQ